MSPGRSGSHVTGLGSPVIESSKALDRVDLVRRRLAAGRQGDGPLDRQAGVVVLGGDREQLEVRVVRLVLVVEAGEQVAVGRGDQRDRPPAVLELRQRPDERRPEVGHDDVDLRVLGDQRGEDPLGLGRIPVGRRERLLADHRVQAGRFEHRRQSLGLVLTLAVAWRAAEHQHVAAVGRFSTIHLPHSTPASKTLCR